MTDEHIEFAAYVASGKRAKVTEEATSKGFSNLVAGVASLGLASLCDKDDAFNAFIKGVCDMMSRDFSLRKDERITALGEAFRRAYPMFKH